MPALKVWDGTAWQTVGTQGSTGAVGPGVPSGGSTGYLLTKRSATDYDTQWTAPPKTMQTGNTVVTTDASGHAGVAFPVGFAAAPVVVVVEASGQAANVAINNVSTANFGFNVRQPNGNPLIGQVRVHWIAVEP